MRFVSADTLSAAGLARAREIYEQNFPPELRAPFESLVDDVALAFVDDELDQGGGVCGFVVLRPMPSTGWLFVRYFVAGVRGRGIGSVMFRALPEAYPEVARIVLDVEDPDEPGLDPAELTERLRRVEFYDRLGVRLLPVRDYHPPHDGHEPTLRLLAWSRDGQAGDVREIVLATYRDRYGLTATQPAVLATLAASGL